MRRHVFAASALSWTLACTGLACNSTGGSSGDDAAAPVSDAGADSAESGSTFGLGQVDRAGRPLVAILLVPGSLVDDYNAAPSFDTPLSRTQQDALSSRLHALDVLELAGGGQDPVDWPLDGGAHPLLPMFATDALLLDPAKPCISADGSFLSTYLDIEREVFRLPPLSSAGHATCGGRTPADGVVDATLALLVTGNREGGAPIVQGVAGPTKQPTTTFPYLADPD